MAQQWHSVCTVRRMTQTVHTALRIVRTIRSPSWSGPAAGCICSPQLSSDASAAHTARSSDATAASSRSCISQAQSTMKSDESSVSLRPVSAPSQAALPRPPAPTLCTAKASSQRPVAGSQPRPSQQSTPHRIAKQTLLADEGRPSPTSAGAAAKRATLRLTHSASMHAGSAASAWPCCWRRCSSSCSNCASCSQKPWFGSMQRRASFVPARTTEP